NEDAWMGSLTQEWLDQNGTKQQDSFVVPVAPLASAPAALQRRVVRAAPRKGGSSLHDVAFENVEGGWGLIAQGKSGKKIQIPGGVEVAREFGNLVFRSSGEPVAEYEYQLKIPGQIHIPEVRKVFRAEIVESEAAETAGQRVFVDAES